MSLAELQVWEWRAGLFVFGAVFGSFLNVVIHRVPRGESVVRPGSRCPACGAPIKAWQNIPILSWLLLRGRCANCRQPISWRYPLVELLTALLWLAVGVRFGVSLQALILLPCATLLLALFFTDYDEMLLPDALTIPMAIVGVAVASWNSRLDLFIGWLGSGTASGRLAHAVVGAVFGFGLFLAIALAGRLAFGKEAMGGGDLKLMLGVGAFLGIPGVVLTLFLGSIVGTFVAIPMLLKGRTALGKTLPFGCFLCPAALLCVFYGNELARWYLGLLGP
ncbi:MAG: prepilin peptidase [Acidobacteriota bacterium]